MPKLRFRRDPTRERTSTIIMPSTHNDFGAMSLPAKRGATATAANIASRPKRAIEDAMIPAPTPTGSVAMTPSPVIQPSKACTGLYTLEPAWRSHHQRGTRMIKGMLIARPSTSNGTLPLAAAATAMTLSRLYDGRPPRPPRSESPPLQMRRRRTPSSSSSAHQQLLRAITEQRQSSAHQFQVGAAPSRSRQYR